ncbi:MAG TPA: hydrogenase maturation peptidase HycI [Methanobacterium sp.]|nr:hydrogenase maturation peptidase HycI [Methanobacterium sp.]
MKDFLKTYDKLVILGIGNEIKGDDALGPNVVLKLNELFKENDNVIVFDGGTVPENYTGLIRKEKPSHIILVDAVEMKKDPGYIRVVQKDEIANYNISTHAMPVSFLIKFMETTIGAEIILVGVQPKSMELAEEISKEVEKSIEIVVKTLLEVLNSSKVL